MRKVVQLVSLNNSLIALCGDGTMWEKNMYQGSKWEQVEEIPKDQIDASAKRIMSWKHPDESIRRD